MRYYFDTRVWINYFDETEFYHKEAVKWFEKMKEHYLFSSVIVEFEINKNKPEYVPLFFSKQKELQNFSLVEISENDKLQADLLSRTTKFDYYDLLHLLTAKRYDLVPVTSDIHHWPKIVRLLDISNLDYISDIYR